MFGDLTLLQKIVNYYINSREGYNYLAKCLFMGCDIIERELENEIDKILCAYPHLLYARDKKEQSLFSYMIRIAPVYYDMVLNIQENIGIPLIHYFLSKGAGIGLTKTDLKFFKVCGEGPFLIGINTNFTDVEEPLLKRHILSHRDIPRLYIDGKLSQKKIISLHSQAENGIKYGNFDDAIKLELTKVCRAIEICTLLNNPKQVEAYFKYNTEILITLFQAMHQFNAGNFPTEMTDIILSHLTGLNFMEVTDMRKKLIAEHLEFFPEAEQRLKI